MDDAFGRRVQEAVDDLRRYVDGYCDELGGLEEVEKLNKNRIELQALLDDAEGWKITSSIHKVKLNTLKTIFYDVEDKLDEFVYHVRQLKPEPEVSSTNSSPILPFLSDLVRQIEKLRIESGKKIKDWMAITDRIPEIDPSYDLNESTSLDPTRVFGRDHDMKIIKDSAGPVIAIVGMGGLGKTTLARYMYNDADTVKKFNLRGWVFFTEPFDVADLTKKMLETLGEEHADRELSLDTLQNRLRKIVEGKSVFLVFDNVWEGKNLNHEQWEVLCRPVLSYSSECKIIVTARSKHVADKVLMADSTYELPFLTDDDCYSLFLNALKHVPSLNSALEQMGKEMCRKCKGLPLAARTLGISLRNEHDVERWEEILNDEDVWATNGDQSNIMGILGVSYHHLPTHLKKCFRYCAVFRKGCLFSKKQLILMWMAHGYIEEQGKSKKQLEDIGEEYINQLLSLSLFEHYEDDETKCTMHDLIHDLARSVSEDERASFENGKLHRCLDNLRHLSIFSPLMVSKLQPVQQLQRCRSVLFFSRIRQPSDVEYLCTEMKHLRVLDMSYTDLKSMLPKRICYLKHLRYLSLQGTKISVLPESIERLCFLETLVLDYCDFIAFPKSICSLKHLRFLSLRGTSITDLPGSLGNLTQLCMLDVECSEINQFPDCILDLKSLRQIRCNDDAVFPSGIRKLTRLCYGDERLSMVKEIADLDIVSSERNEHTKVLSLIWIKHQPRERDGEALQCIAQHPNVMQLYMQGYGGNSLGSRFSDLSSLTYLNRIDLVRCENLSSFPPLGNFHHLSHLQIESAKSLVSMGCPEVQQGTNRIPVIVPRTGRTPPPFTVVIVDCPNLTLLDVYDYQAVQVVKIIRCPQFHLICLQWLSSLLHLSIAESQQDIPYEFSYETGFQSLEVLKLENMPNWKSWRGPRSGECPKLRQFSVVDCPNASFCSETNLRGVEVLKIHNCPQLQDLYLADLISQEKFPKICISDSSMRLQAVDDNYRCTLSRSDFNSYPVPEKITIVDCPKLSCLSSVDSKALRVLKLIACPEIQLSCLGQLPSLRHLSVIQCNQDIPADFSSDGFLQLETLELEDLPKWTTWAGPREGECCKLLKLSIVDCNRLVNFSINCLESLQDVYIDISHGRVASRVFRRNIEKFCRMKRYYVSEELELISHWYSDLDVAREKLFWPRSLSARLEKFSSIHNLILYRCKMPVSWTDELLNQMTSLEAIQLEWCQNIRILCLHSQHSLKYLSVKGRFGPSIVECRSSVLRFLELHTSYHMKPTFTPHDGLANLEYLSIKGFEINEIHWEQLSSTLKVLEAQWSFRYCFSSYNYESLRELRCVGVNFRCFGRLRLPSSLKVLETIDCAHWNPGDVLDNLEELRIINCKGLVGFESMQWLSSSTLRVLELSKLYSDGVCIPIHQLKYVERLILKDCPFLDFPEQMFDLPPTLQELCIIRCPRVEDWCTRNSTRLTGIRVLKEEEVQHQARYTTATLLPYAEEEVQHQARYTTATLLPSKDELKSDRPRYQHRYSRRARAGDKLKAGQAREGP